MNYKRAGDRLCYRCGDARKLHLGAEEQCQKPFRKGSGRGDGCFKSNYRYDQRVTMSLNLDQAEFVGRLLMLITRGADVSVLVRSDRFIDAQRIISRASLRARERREGKEKAA